jgi:serine/threonine protein kinase
MGKRIGQYELKTKLGKGTFGTVYLGKHIPSKNKIAVKMINREGLKPEQQNRLEQEILCQRSVTSDYIVSLIDVQKTENNFYLILEYCEGGDLGQFIKTHGPVDEETTQRWMQNLAEGFKALKSKNIIHRDLKLQNILMSENSTKAVLKLADFGMSRFLDNDLAQTWLGTPLYMAPEMFRNKEGYDFKADIWSLGVVMYEMLTGEAPIRVQKREDIPLAQKNLKKWPPGISSTCSDLLSKLLTYNPKDRISFEELFIHPFINSNEEPSKPEEKTESVPQDDFELLDDNETGNDFIFLRPDIHPAVNLTEFISSTLKNEEICEVIEKLAVKLKNSKELIGAFALFIKSSVILSDMVNKSKDLVDLHGLAAVSYPLFFERFEKLKKLFQDSRAKTDELCKEIENLLDEQKKNAKHEGSTKQLLAENLIFNYSITLCKEAAKDEYLRDYLKAGEKYKEAILLLDFLVKDKNENNPDWNAFQNFVEETHRRFETVNVKLTTA